MSISSTKWSLWMIALLKNKISPNALISVNITTILNFIVGQERLNKRYFIIAPQYYMDILHEGSNISKYEHKNSTCWGINFFQNTNILYFNVIFIISKYGRINLQINLSIEKLQKSVSYSDNEQEVLWILW